MVTYKPIKKWLVPIVSIVFGFWIGFSVFPSQQEYQFKGWVNNLDKVQDDTYKVKSIYKRDDKVYSSSQGIWGTDLAKFDITTPISDGTSFVFSLYFTDDKFYIHSGEEWKYGTMPHRLVQEFSPLDNPFEWAKQLLKDADRVSVEEDESGVRYTAKFDDFNDVEFRGVILQKQKSTTLEMKVSEGDVKYIKFEASPIRPSTVGPLVSYPDKLTYEINFERIESNDVQLPENAYIAEEIE